MNSSCCRVFSLLFITVLPVFGQTTTLEKSDFDSAWHTHFKGEGYVIALDSQQAYTSNYSLRLAPTSENDSSVLCFPLSLVSNTGKLTPVEYEAKLKQNQYKNVA